MFTFLIASRNDLYCGDAPGRLGACLRALTWHIANSGIDAEVLVIDWNSIEPLRHRSWQIYHPVHFIDVPPVIANSVAPDVAMSEVHALNVGARHAAGDFILRLDQDTIVGYRFFDFLSTTKDLQSLWWSGRRDTSEMEYTEILRNPIEYFQFDNNIPHWGGHPDGSKRGRGAVGVFGMPKAMWHQERGYNEALIYWCHMEIEFVERILARGVPCIDVGEATDTDFYHIWHERADDKKTNEMYNKDIEPNPPSWGLDGKVLSRHVTEGGNIEGS